MADFFIPFDLEWFCVFILPGFFSIKTFDLLVAGPRRDFSKSIFEVVCFSAINFLIFYPLLALINKVGIYHTHENWFYVSLFVMLVVGPVVWPLIYIKLATGPFRNFLLHPTPTAWDYYFSRRKCSWVIVHLKNGQKIGGKYWTNSFASAYPSKPDLYLEEMWKLDVNGAFQETVERSQGILILSKDISMIEFFS